MFLHFLSPLLAWGGSFGLDLVAVAILTLIFFSVQRLPTRRPSPLRPLPPSNSGSGSPEDDPHAGVNFYFIIVFLLSIGFLMVSSAFHALSQSEKPGSASEVSAPPHPSHFIPARPFLRPAP